MANSKNSLQTTPDTLQPHNVDAEEALLGSLLIDSDAIMRVATFLDENDFFVERNGWIFKAIRDLYERREPSDLVTLSDELERRNQLYEIGGPAHLTSLINATPTSIHAEFYGRILERTALLRRLIDVAGKIARMAYEDQNQIDEVVDRAEELLFGVTSRRKGRDVIDLPTLVSQLMDKIDYLQKFKGQFIGIPTGLTDLDKLLGGLKKSDMIVIGGRPSMGKTSLALSIVLNAARLNNNVAIFSLEMSDEQITQRFMSIESGINLQQISSGQVSDEQWPSLTKAMSKLSGYPNIFIEDTSIMSSFDLRSKARRLHAERGLDLIVIDYIQLMEMGGKVENRQQEISQISRHIKLLARELNIPVIALSQLSRNLESRADKRPMLSDLRESGSIEQDSDVVLFIYRDEVYNEDSEFINIAEVICAKHRNGPIGKVQAFFKKTTAQFTDLDISREPLNY